MPETDLTKRIKVERIKTYSDQLASDIGKLMPALSARLSDKPISESRLRAIIEAPDKEQFVAKLDGEIVGSAVLNIVVGNVSRKAWLEDFVTSPKIRGQGAGYKLWLDMLKWCRQRGIQNLVFTSHESRKQAHAFYRRQGVGIRDTTVFHLRIPPVR